MRKIYISLQLSGLRLAMALACSLCGTARHGEVHAFGGREGSIFIITCSASVFNRSTPSNNAACRLFYSCHSCLANAEKRNPSIVYAFCGWICNLSYIRLTS